MSGLTHVLVVEDDPDVREALVETLHDAGYRVSSADNGLHAIRVLESAAELPALILLDLMMPVMDGQRFLETIRSDARLSTLPVVLLSADGGTSSRAQSLGAQTGLRKPVQLDELLAIVMRYGPPA